jgi:hypothetical protein
VTDFICISSFLNHISLLLHRHTYILHIIYILHTIYINHIYTKSTNAVCREGQGYPPNACPCVAMRQEYGVTSGKGFGALPKSLYKAWGQLKCDAVLCEPLRPREEAAARTGEKFPCKRKFFDDVLKFPVKDVDANKNKKKRKKKMVQIK